jgi:hypothetical protein
MSRIPINLAAVQENTFPVFPPGSYTLLVKEVRQEAAKSSGELKLSVQFEIVDGPNGGTEFAGKKLFSSYSLSEKAAWRVKKLCVAAGMTNEQINDGVDDELLLGCQIRADIAVEKYNNRDVNRVGNESPLSNTPSVGGPGVAPLNGTTIPAVSAIPAGWGTPGSMPAPPPAKPVG